MSWPPLPPPHDDAPNDTDAELEAILSEHVELVTPPPALVARTQRGVHERLRPAGAPVRWLALGGALLAIVATAWLLAPRPDDPAPPATTPSASPSPVETPAPTPEPTASPTLTATATPAPTATPTPTPAPPDGEPLVLTLQGKPEQVAADYDYDVLQEQLKATVIVTGRIVKGAQASQATLRVDRILRGKPAQLVKLKASSSLTACEGVPDFTRFAGQDVCVFLTVRPDGSTTLHHGATSLRPLPYHGYLGVDGLREVARTGAVSDARLGGLIKQRGPRVLTRVQRDLRNATFGGPDVQDALEQALWNLPAAPKRVDVMPIARHLQRRPTLDQARLQVLRRYHDTFLRRQGRWVRLPSGEHVDNGYAQHVIFLRFVGRWDARWARLRLEATLRRIDPKVAPKVVQLYQGALNALPAPKPPAPVAQVPKDKGALTVRLEDFPRGARFVVEGKAKNYPDGTLLHVKLTTPKTAKGGEVELVFLQARVEKQTYQVIKAFPHRTFAPLRYTVRVELILSSQRRAIREWIRRDLGLPRSARVTVARKTVSRGTEAERAAFLSQTRSDLACFVRDLEQPQAAIAVQVRSGRVDPTNAAGKAVATILGRLATYLKARVGWPEQDVIRGLQTAGAELGRSVRHLQKGKVARAQAALQQAERALERAEQTLERRSAE